MTHVSRCVFVDVIVLHAVTVPVAPPLQEGFVELDTVTDDELIPTFITSTGLVPVTENDPVVTLDPVAGDTEWLLM